MNFEELPSQVQQAWHRMIEAEDAYKNGLIESPAIEELKRQRQAVFDTRKAFFATFRIVIENTPRSIDFDEAAQQHLDVSNVHE